MSIIVMLIQKPKQVSFASGQQKPAGYMVTDTDEIEFVRTLMKTVLCSDRDWVLSEEAYLLYGVSEVRPKTLEEIAEVYEQSIPEHLKKYLL